MHLLVDSAESASRKMLENNLAKILAIDRFSLFLQQLSRRSRGSRDNSVAHMTTARQRREAHRFLLQSV